MTNTPAKITFVDVCRWSPLALSEVARDPERLLAAVLLSVVFYGAGQGSLALLAHASSWPFDAWAGLATIVGASALGVGTLPLLRRPGKFQRSRAGFWRHARTTLSVAGANGMAGLVLLAIDLAWLHWTPNLGGQPAQALLSTLREGWHPLAIGSLLWAAGLSAEGLPGLVAGRFQLAQQGSLSALDAERAVYRAIRPCFAALLALQLVFAGVIALCLLWPMAAGPAVVALGALWRQVWARAYGLAD